MGNTIAGRIDRIDPVSIVFAAHSVVLAASDRLARPVAVLVLTALLLAVRYGFAIVARRATESEASIELAGAVASTILVGAVVAADGGTESPLFFWFLILLAWQALRFTRQRFLWLCGAAAVSYVLVLVVADDVTSASLGRFGLFVTFMFVLASGRTMIDEYQLRVRRMDAMVSTVVQDMPMAVAIFDADRETVLYANGMARAMGLVDRDAMARLIVADPAAGSAVSLAHLIHQRAWEPLRPQVFTALPGHDRLYRIGFHPRRLEDGAPILVVYGEEASSAT